MRFAATGPRDVGLDDSRSIGIIRAAIVELRDVAEFSQGAQFGVDTWAWREALSAHPAALQRAVVPVGLPHNEALVALLVRLAMAREPAEVVLAEGGYLARNRRLLDFADVLLAFPATPREVLRSGTWACVREARRRGLTVWFYPLDGSPRWVAGTAAGRARTSG